MNKIRIGYVEIVYDDGKVSVYNSFPLKDLLKAVGFTYSGRGDWYITAEADSQRIEDLRYGIEEVKVLRSKGGEYWSYWDTVENTSIRVNGQKVKVFETEEQFLEFLKTLEELLENLLRTSQEKVKKMVSEITVSREGDYSLKVDIGFKHWELEKALEKAGFAWSRDGNVYTITIGHHREAERIARNLAELMGEQDDEIVLEVLGKFREEVLSVGEEYRNRLKADIVIPAPEGKSYKEYQKEFVLLARDREKFILADEMGLGKTIQAIALINLLEPKHALIVAPAFLRINWKRELEEWLTYDIDIYTIESRKEGMEVITKDRGIFIISYDLLDILFDRINKRFELAVYDEAHYLKNPDAKRTLFGLLVKSNRYLFLTGTPFLNRATELANIFYFIKRGTPEGVKQEDLRKHIKNFYWEFARRYFYLIEREVRDRKVYDVGCVKNPNRLSADLSPYILRRTKDEVLAELPDKIRKIIRFSDKNVESLVEKEKTLYMKLKGRGLTRAPRIEDEDINEDDKPDYRQVSREQMMEYLQRRIEEMEGTLAELALVRHYLGLSKINLAVEYIENILEETGDKRLVVMTWHKDVAYYLAKELESKYKILLNTGDTKDRDDKVRQFQSDSEETIIFISTIKAGGLGLTLTKARRMVFVELSYVPADIWQAEDRIHRIGQKDVAEIHFLIFDSSIDEHTLSLVERKKGEFTNILDISEAQEEQYRLFVEETEG